MELIFIVIVIVLVEVFLSLMHFRFYYVYGLTLCFEEINLPRDLPGTLFETGNAINGNVSSFTIASLSETEIGFRRIIKRNNHSFFRGLIVYDPQARRLKFSIKLNWSVFAFLLLGYILIDSNKFQLQYGLLMLLVVMTLAVFDFYTYRKFCKSFKSQMSHVRISQLKREIASNSVKRDPPPEYNAENDSAIDSTLVACTHCRETYFRVDLAEPYCPQCQHPISGIET